MIMAIEELSQKGRRGQRHEADMASPTNKVGSKRYGLFALAIAMLAAGAVLSFVINDRFVLRSIGMLMIVASVYLVRASNVHGDADRAVTDGSGAVAEDSKRVTGRIWVLAPLSLVGCVVSYHFLYEDALHGYHQLWPLYLFVGTALVCACIWGWMAVKFTS